MAKRHDELSNELHERKEKSRKVRRAFERDWYLNTAFLANEQYVAWVPQTDETGRLVSAFEDDEIEAEQVNVLAKIVRTERAKLLKAVPKPEALPMTASYEDLQTARILTAYFDDLTYRKHFDRKLRQASYWIMAGGNVYLKFFWDGDGPNMNVVSPLDMFPDPYAKSFYDSRWVIETKFMDPDRAQELYADLATKEGKKNLEHTSTENVSGLEHRLFYNFGDGDRQLSGTVINEYWEPPNKTHPNGRWVVFTTGGIVVEGDFMYAHGQLPYTHVGHIERAHSQWHASIVDYLRPLQKELNSAQARVTRNAQLSQGKWVINTQVELEQDPDNLTGQKLEWSGPPEFEPTLVTNSALPPWVQEEPARLQAIMEDLAMQHEVTNAGVPGRVDSGSAIQLLQESDDSVMKDTIHSLEEAVERGFTMVARLFAQYGTANMIVPVYDKEGFIEVEYMLKKDDIPAEQRVRVKTTTGLPQSVAGRFDKVMQLWQYGILQDPKVALELIDLGTLRPDWDQTQLDKSQAFRENISMRESGNPITPGKHENHSVHLQIHRQFMKTDAFRDLDIERQQLYAYHVEMHEQGELQALQKELELQMMLQGGAEGAPAEGGQPPEGGAPAPGPETAPQP